MKKLFIITGEHSGDKHAANVVKEIQKSGQYIEIQAVGGKNLSDTGIKLFADHSKMSAVGLGFKIIIDHIMLGKRIVDYLKNDFKPDMVLLVDYGGFNLSIAKVLKKLDIKVYYYIPPQIWASRKWRLNTVKKYIDKVITIFPFENKMYKDAGVDVEFSGHPLLEEVPPKANKDAFFDEFDLDKNKKLVSIFPGSRSFEIKELLKIFVKASDIIKKEDDNVQFVICQAPTIKDDWFKDKIPSDIKIIKNKNYELLSISDALMLASGTVALEAALYETPMIISYRGPWLFYLIYLLVRCIKMVSLPNIIMDDKIIPELIQSNAKPVIIANHILNILHDAGYRNNMVTSLKNVKEKLSEENSAKKTSTIILNNI
ncbi:MAG: lipid-A-disaccharide synthase [Candidatus Gastranaerophilales bacterium]|nr:lipid-A-disaccharide synthase [Candidatus Gastranaerophilales bacterium]